MDTPRPCGCKGCRSCLVCEKDFQLNCKRFHLKKSDGFVYCPWCDKGYPGWDLNDFHKHPNHGAPSITFPGVYIKLDFLNEAEELELLNGIDGDRWDLSQSGRRKQNYGPKCNFKKNRLKDGDFNGFPKFSEFVQKKFAQIPILENFETIEQCSLEYDPERGASIDPHIDDCWIWGERIVTVNLLSDSVLTMTFNNQKRGYYNLEQVQSYPSVLNVNGEFNTSGDCYKLKCDDVNEIVRIPMPRRSLLVLYNSARYDWEHQILREDITERRVCLAYREFTPPYLPGGQKHRESEDILYKAKMFFK